LLVNIIVGVGGAACGDGGATSGRVGSPDLTTEREDIDAFFEPLLKAAIAHEMEMSAGASGPPDQ